MTEPNNNNHLAQMASFRLDLAEGDESLLNSDDEGAVTPAINAVETATVTVSPLTRGHSSTESFPATDSDASDSELEEVLPPLRRHNRSTTSSAASSVSFGEARTMSGQLLHRVDSIDARSRTPAPVARAIVPMDSLGRIDHSDHSDRTMMASNLTVSPATGPPQGSSKTFKYRSMKGVLKNSKPGPTVQSSSASAAAPSDFDLKKRNRLTKISAMYDLDGDGVLDEVEQAMRDRDVDGDGQLDNAEVYRIVQDQLKSQEDVHLYRKVAAGLTCLVAILTISNFGTSWASAILAKDTVAESASGTIQSKATGEVMAFQAISHIFELEELTDEEFNERRRLVDAAIAEDPDHPDHAHRRLGKKKNKKNPCTCSKIAYDHGKIRQEDLRSLTEKCDGVNQVNVRRKWRDDVMEAYDYDTLCGPGTEVVKKGRKKGNKKGNKDKNKKDKNKKGSKTEFVEEKVTFRRKGRNGEDRSITFDCDRGNCYSSGETLHQRENHPCRLEREWIDFASECAEGLTCYNPSDQTARRGNGVCTRLQRFAREGQICDVDLGVNACSDNLGCFSLRSAEDQGVGVDWDMQVHVGVCQQVQRQAGEFQICDVSFDAQACVAEYECLGYNGRSIGRSGIGFCTRSAGGHGGGKVVVEYARYNEVCDGSFGNNACVDNYQCFDASGRLIARGYGVCGRSAASTGGNLGWHVDYSLGSQGQCTNDGTVQTWEEDEVWSTPQECCEQKLWWLTLSQCVPGYAFN
eukprot:CAMPEP_0183750032 /NCGR_PEP_ID=MMETSP0739-20130205/762_1 /TAXON_ID=385413 /ORGANISM="Thalassiosira miniscula, Strain CCMP1093" /LENGTH=746 /DNA_ID=CAMNT_0025985949 /DNA_START=269 /DNA_END=2509 /DNA_ORIENTATION=-